MDQASIFIDINNSFIDINKWIYIYIWVHLYVPILVLSTVLQSCNVWDG